MNEAKGKRQKLLNCLQSDICKNYRLHYEDFYDQFDKFLFNYSILLLNPSKKNDLLCSQLLFLGCTSHFFSRGKQRVDSDGGSGGDDDGGMRVMDLSSGSGDDYSDVSIGRKSNQESVRESDEGEAMLAENLEQKKKEILEVMGKEKDGISDTTMLRKDDGNPLIACEHLNEYINRLMLKSKEVINYTEELFFLLCQLAIHYKHNLYSSVLMSLIKVTKIIKKYIDIVKYVQILIFLSDVKLNRAKAYIFKCMIHAVMFVNRRTKDEALKRKILLLLHEAFIENGQKKRIRRKYTASNATDATTYCTTDGMGLPQCSLLAGMEVSEQVNNFACSVLIELLKKNVYANRRNINFLCEGIFFKNVKIVKCICFALLGKYDNKDFVVKMEKMKEDRNKDVEQLKSISNQSHQKLTKAKIKKLNQQKVIDSIYDPYTFTSNIFNLITTKYRYNNGIIKMLLLNVLCRIYQRHKIVEENFFVYYEDILKITKNKNIVSKYLCLLIQSIHDHIPITLVRKIVYVLIKQFLSSHLSEEYIYLIINTIIEIILKCPNCLNDDIFQSVIVFKDFKNKPIAVLIRRFINICRDVNPSILEKKLLDKKTAILMHKRKFENFTDRDSDANTILRFSYILYGGKKHMGRISEAGIDKAGIDKAGIDEAGIDEAGNDEAGNDEAGNDEAGNDEAGNDESGSDKAENDKSGNDESGNDESGNDKAENDKSGNDESGNDESGNDEAGSDEAGSDEAGNDESGSDDESDGAGNEDESDSANATNDANAANTANAANITNTGGDKVQKKRTRREERRKRVLEVRKRNVEVLSERILTDDDFRKLRKMRDYIESNGNVALSELVSICNAEGGDEESDDSSSEDGREKLITEEDLQLKKKIKKKHLTKIKENKTEYQRFKTNKEKDKKKSVMMLMQKLKRKKKNAVTQYGKLKKKLKGKLAARAKKRGILNRRVAKKLGRRKR
ncbi:protein SDA1, putative (SDA1) [Plasmodium ovale curtisi]|uniref:Protein SDA1, putative (SDA1) n=1 Tax=Plasmodium ovale curtisi TaxID=864141 RepID=A0A1A8VNU4_PLAOA|nr:protein SDA1, putative (SDA1) [Plasmodium ovale curtisi]